MSGNRFARFFRERHIAASDCAAALDLSRVGF